MGKFFMGLLTGLILCVLGALLALPGVKKTAYDSGYAEGNKKGMDEGKNAGIKLGMDQLNAQQAEKHRQDSVTAAKRYQAAKRKAAMERKKAAEKPKPIQNWHVIDGKIDEPIR